MIGTFLTRSRSALIAGIALILTGFTLVFMAQPGQAVQGQYTVPLNQEDQLPIKAAEYSAQEDSCSGVSPTEDGWHFVVPGGDTDFVELRVTFDPGGDQIITDFGPPDDKHAYVASEAGAELTAAEADVVTEEGKKKITFFNLSHTCPAALPPPTPSPSPSPSPSPDESPSPSPSPDESPSPSPSPDESPSPSPSPPESPGPEPSPSEPEAPGPAPSPGDGAPPTLPKTGVDGGGLAGEFGVGLFLILAGLALTVNWRRILEVARDA